MGLVAREIFLVRACIICKVAIFVTIVRFLFDILQLIFSLLPDHDADAFRPPKLLASHFSVDNIFGKLFDGLSKWDSIYFIFVAKYGYLYENTIAFFPFFPWITSCVSRPTHALLSNFISIDVIIQASGFFINFVASILTCIQLYRLGIHTLGNERLSMVSVILFILNPACIFFSSLYSESLYLLFTVSGLLSIERKNVAMSTLYFAVACATRSNGLLNCGFLMYRPFLACSRLILNLPYFIFEDSHKSPVEAIQQCIFWWCNFLGNVIPCLLSCMICITPFVLYQIYCYLLYCSFYLDRNGFSWLLPSFPDESLTQFAEDKHMFLPRFISVDRNDHNNSPASPKWCSETLPVPYMYVQKSIWDVGPFRYFTLKQIPNFVLACPVILLGISAAVAFYKRAPKAYRTLGVISESPSDRRLVPHVFHLLFLCVYGFTHIHVQVLTRMIFSSCPLIYWYGARLLDQEPKVTLWDNQISTSFGSAFRQHRYLHSTVNCTRKRIEQLGYCYKSDSTSRDMGKSSPSGVLCIPDLPYVTIFSPGWVSYTIGWVLCLLNPKNYRYCRHRALISYFLLYALIGCALHSNFLPWT
ncbi:unnamed protein product [Protopolystoma xenopodis]|uniref:GPI mannosyltransferase 2 n=1 Tax=Protopolystoma xenopodis TaxID=117903 RepID=A0A448WKV7_9PLAT|nr:unnamed protein product [Protopolystoma xenopodis]